jgi:hypothetical protein
VGYLKAFINVFSALGVALLILMIGWSMVVSIGVDITYENCINEAAASCVKPSFLAQNGIWIWLFIVSAPFIAYYTYKFIKNN